jgi:hypothetical protein
MSLRLRQCEVYNDVVRVLTMLGKRGEIRKEELPDFRFRTQDAALLFDGEIALFMIKKKFMRYPDVQSSCEYEGSRPSGTTKN